MAMSLPALTEQEQGALGQGDVAVAVALAGADVEEHAPGIDVADFQVERFAQAQAAGVNGGQRDAMIEGGDGSEDQAALGGGEDDRSLNSGVARTSWTSAGQGRRRDFSQNILMAQRAWVELEREK